MRKLAVIAFTATLIAAAAGCASTAPWTPPSTTATPPLPVITIVGGPANDATVTAGQIYSFTAVVENAPANSTIKWWIYQDHPLLGGGYLGTDKCAGELVGTGSSVDVAFQITEMSGFDVADSVLYACVYDHDAQFPQFWVAKDSRAYTATP